MTKIIRKKITSGLVETLGMDFTINDNGSQHGRTLECRYWEMFMEYPTPVIPTDDKGKDLPKKTLVELEKVYVEAFESEKAKAIVRLTQVVNHAPGAVKLWNHATNNKVGDGVADPKTEDPMGTLSGIWESVKDGTWKVRGSVADAAETVREMLAGLDAEQRSVMSKSAAKKAFAADSAALFVKIAAGHNMTVAAYTANLESRVAAMTMVVPVVESAEKEAA